MGFGQYPEEQEEYLEMIDNWVNRKDHAGSRELMLLGAPPPYISVIPTSNPTPIPTLVLTLTPNSTRHFPIILTLNSMRWLL